jgi:hypothetical protein
MAYRGSEDFKIAPLYQLNATPGELFGPYDIGGTNASSNWIDMADFDRVYSYIGLGTWNTSDNLDTCKLQQATSSAGAGVKDLTTSGSGVTYNYDTTYSPNTIGDFVILEARAEDLDNNNGFHWVRVYVAETGNTGVDDVQGFLMLHNKAHKIAQIQGATVAADDGIHYVTPQSAGGL